MLELRQMARSCRRRWSPAQVMKLCLAWSVWVLATEMELVGLVLVLTQAVQQELATRCLAAVEMRPAMEALASSEEPPTEAATPTSPRPAHQRDS